MDRILPNIKALHGVRLFYPCLQFTLFGFRPDPVSHYRDFQET